MAARSDCLVTVLIVNFYLKFSGSFSQAFCLFVFLSSTIILSSVFCVCHCAYLCNLSVPRP